jgi:multiple sugar transport system substrate-binding protein
MKTPRKLGRIFITATLVTGLAAGSAACGSGGGSTSGQPTVALASGGAIADWTTATKKNLGGTTITVAAATHPATTSMQTLAKEFTAQTGITVKFDVTDENSLQNKEKLDYQSNAGRYDVNMIDAFWLADFASLGITLPLDSTLKDPAKTPSFYDYQDLYPAYSKGLSQIKGVTYGIPLAGETRFVAYRKDLFAKYGKQPPKTMDEMLSLAKFFKGKDGVYGISMRGQKGIQFASGLLTVMYQFSDGFFNPKTGANQIASPENVQALQYYVDLLKNAPPDVSSYTNEEAESAFTAGKAAMWFDATSLAPDLLDPSKSAVVDKVGFVAPPSGPRGSYGALAGWNLGVAAHSKHQDAAWAFIMWLTSKPNAPAFVSNGGSATRTSVVNAPANDVQKVYYPAMSEALKSAGNLVDQGISWIPSVPQSLAKLVVIGNHGSDALAGNVSPQKALLAAQTEAAGIK